MYERFSPDSNPAAMLAGLLAILLLLGQLPGALPAAARGQAPDFLSPLPIEKGDAWLYFKGTLEPPADWKDLLFDDSGWTSGPTGIGYGALDNDTVLSDMQNSYLSVYARRGFYVEDHNTVGGLLLEMTYDDGFVAYLNGVEVARRNLAGTPPASTQAAASSLGSPGHEYFDLDPALLLSGNNVLAVQMHNASLGDDDLTLLPALRESGPYLQSVTSQSAILRWEMHQAAPSKARYRQQGDTTWTEIDDPGPTARHVLQASGLAPATTYEYQVSQDGTAKWIPGTPAAFRTAPGATGSFRVAVYGDSRTQYIYHGLVAQSVAYRSPDLMVHLGDLVEFGEELEGWSKEFFGPAAGLLARTPLYSTPGNHEHDGSGSFLYTDFFSLPGNELWYAFSYGCTRWISLDTTADFSPGSPQYTWLVDELQSDEFSKQPWQIVFTHYPAYTSGPHLSSERPVVDYLVPLFEQYGVDLVFGGHNHHYERSQKAGIFYLVSGGGGAGLNDFPNQSENPYSQVRVQDYQAVQLDFACSSLSPDDSNGSLNYAVYNAQNVLIDSLPQMQHGTPRLYLPVAFR